MEETEIFEPTNLELSWEMLELARLGFTKTGDKEQLAEVYLDLGQVCMENQDYDLAVMDFGESLKLKKVLVPTDSRYCRLVFSLLYKSYGYVQVPGLRVLPPWHGPGLLRQDVRG